MRVHSRRIPKAASLAAYNRNAPWRPLMVALPQIPHLNWVERRDLSLKETLAVLSHPISKIGVAPPLSCSAARMVKINNNSNKIPRTYSIGTVDCSLTRIWRMRKRTKTWCHSLISSSEAICVWTKYKVSWRGASKATCMNKKNLLMEGKIRVNLALQLLLQGAGRIRINIPLLNRE